MHRWLAPALTLSALAASTLACSPARAPRSAVAPPSRAVSATPQPTPTPTQRGKGRRGNKLALLAGEHCVDRAAQAHGRVADFVG